MSDDSKRIELPKTLQERMLKFFLKAETQRGAFESNIDREALTKSQNSIKKDDRSSG